MPTGDGAGPSNGGGDGFEPTTIHGDNQGSIALAKNPVYHQRTKHIATQYHFTREKVAQGVVELVWISTKEMLADLLTKAAGKATLLTLRPLLMGWAS